METKQLKPPTTSTPATAGLWLLPRLVSHGLLELAESSLLRQHLLRGDPRCVAAIELYLINIEEDGAADTLSEDLKLVADTLSETSSTAAEIVKLPLTPRGSVCLPPSASMPDLSLAAGAPTSPPPPPPPASMSPLGRRSPKRMQTTAVDESGLRAVVAGTGKQASVLLRKDLIIMMFAADMRPVAEEVALLARGRVVLHEVLWNKFPDGFPDLFIENVKDVRYHHCCYLASLSSPSSLFEQISVMHSLARYGPKSFTIVVPYYPTGTHERITRMGQVATAATLARLMSSTPPAASGCTALTIFDIHALQELFYFTDNVLVRLKSCISLLKAELARMGPVSIAFPDEGALKRFKPKFEDFPLIVCEKRRDGETRRVTIKEGDCVGRTVVIVDDLVQSGGTLLSCANAVKEAGAASVSAFCTHGVFPLESWRKFVDGPLETFFITNTIPSSVKVLPSPPFRVLSIAPTVLSALSPY